MHTESHTSQEVISMKHNPSVKATCPNSELQIEVWKGKDVAGGPRVVLRVVNGNGRGIQWLMMKPAEWKRLQTLVNAHL